jgi:hypothetical protein
VRPYLREQSSEPFEDSTVAPGLSSTFGSLSSAAHTVEVRTRHPANDERMYFITRLALNDSLVGLFRPARDGSTDGLAIEGAAIFEFLSPSTANLPLVPDPSVHPARDFSVVH